MFKWLFKTDAEKFAEKKAKEEEWEDGEYKVLYLNCDDGWYVIDQEVNFSDYQDLRNALLAKEPFSFVMPNGMEYFVFDFKNNMVIEETTVNKTLGLSHYYLRGLDPKKHENGEIYRKPLRR